MREEVKGKQRNWLCFDGRLAEISQCHNTLAKKAGAVLGIRSVD